MIIDDLKNYRTEELEFEIERRKEEVNKPEIWINQQTADAILEWLFAQACLNRYDHKAYIIHDTKFIPFLNSLISEDNTKKICQFVADSIVNSGTGIVTGTDICVPHWAIEMAFKAGNSLEDRNNG